MTHFCAHESRRFRATFRSRVYLLQNSHCCEKDCVLAGIFYYFLAWHRWMIGMIAVCIKWLRVIQHNLEVSLICFPLRRKILKYEIG